MHNTSSHKPDFQSDAENRWAERARCLEDAQTIAWLDREPLYRHTLLTLALDESRQHTFDLAGRTPSDQALIEAERTHVLRYFCATTFGACPICFFAPVVTFTDGRAIEYPALAIHRCDGVEAAALTSRTSTQSASRPSRTLRRVAAQ